MLEFQRFDARLQGDNFGFVFLYLLLQAFKVFLQGGLVVRAVLLQAFDHLCSFEVVLLVKTAEDAPVTGRLRFKLAEEVLLAFCRLCDNVV